VTRQHNYDRRANGHDKPRKRSKIKRKIKIRKRIKSKIKIKSRISMGTSLECWLDHEKLEVYRESIAFIAWLSTLLEGTVRIGEVKDQLDRASTSIPLNIAEGNGKYALKDRCRFFDIAHGSALECAAALDVMVARAKLTPDQIRHGKERLQKIVRMLMGLIKRNSTREYDKGSAAD
jgi:four helix bundle protein